MVEDKESLICHQCKTVSHGEPNFCKECGTKLVEVCNCWVKKTKLNCGQVKCPGFSLYKFHQSKQRA